MNGHIFKGIILTFALCSVAFISPMTFASSTNTRASNNKDINKNNSESITTTKTQNSGSGCMACHQGDTSSPDEANKK